MLEYKQEIPAMEDLLALYSSVGWTNYTNNPSMLEEAVKASLWQLAVYDEKEARRLHSLGRRWSLCHFCAGSLGATRSPAPRHWHETLRRGFSDLPQCLSTAPCH